MIQNRTKIRLGQWNLTCQGKDCSHPPHLEVGIEDKVIHSRYNYRRGNSEDDIALVRIDTDLKFVDQESATKGISNAIKSFILLFISYVSL